MKILIVEDNEINVKILELMLRKLNFDYQVSVACDADSAISITKADFFDLILMDINLGNGQMTGTEVMKLLKNEDAYRAIPIYAVTCYNLPGDREKFLEAGFDKYIPKPLSQDMLLQEITEEYSVQK
ncbi:MAG: response regulator [Bacteroidota bacterium]